MNKTEKIAKEWLENNGIQGLVFQRNCSPDFIDANGLGYEVKLSRNNSITFSSGQVDALIERKNVTVLVMEKNNPNPIAQIPINEIKDKDTWHNYRIRCYSTKEKPFLMSISIELKQLLSKQAEESGLSLSAYMRMLLTEHEGLENKRAGKAKQPNVKIITVPQIIKELKKDAQKGIVTKDEFNTLNKDVLSEIAELAKKARE